jgi:hypothetical protein
VHIASGPRPSTLDRHQTWMWREWLTSAQELAQHTTYLMIRHGRLLSNGSIRNNLVVHFEILGCQWETSSWFNSRLAHWERMATAICHDSAQHAAWQTHT